MIGPWIFLSVSLIVIATFLYKFDNFSVWILEWLRKLRADSEKSYNELEEIRRKTEEVNKRIQEEFRLMDVYIHKYKKEYGMGRAFKLKQDIVIPAGTVFKDAPVKTTRAEGVYFDHVIGLTDDTAGTVTYEIGDMEEDLKEWFEEVAE